MDGLAIAAALAEMRPAVVGATIRAVYQPERETYVLYLFARQDLRLLVSPRRAAIHRTLLDLQNPQTPSPFVMLLRKHLRGARLDEVRQHGWERVISLDVIRRRDAGPERVSLVAELLGIRGNLLLVREGLVLASLRSDERNQPGSPYTPPTGQGKRDPASLTEEELRPLLASPDPDRALVRAVDGMGRETARAVLTRAASLDAGPVETRARQALAFVLAHLDAPRAEVDPRERTAFFFPLIPAGEPMASFSAALDQAHLDAGATSDEAAEERTAAARLGRAVAKRERTRKRMEDWLTQSEKADVLQHQADLLLTHRTDLERKMKKAMLPDPATGETVEVALDPRLSPIGNAQALYERAKHLRRGRPVVERRLRRLREELRVLDEALVAVKRGEEPGEAALTLAAPPLSRARGRPRAAAGPRTVRILDHVVQVGRSAAENDLLLRQARPDDLWFHVKGFAGSHVVVRRPGMREVPREVLEGAARLAARHSKARGEKRVEVSYTAAKHVRKPKGAPPGLVVLAREDTLTVDMSGPGEPA